MTKCEKKGHNYEARYHYGEPTMDVNSVRGTASQIDAMASLVRSTRTQTYVHDICTRCGHIVKVNQ